MPSVDPETGPSLMKIIYTENWNPYSGIERASKFLFGSINDLKLPLESPIRLTYALLLIMRCFETIRGGPKNFRFLKHATLHHLGHFFCEKV